MLDPSIYGVVEAFCEKHDVAEIEILRALLLTVVEEHTMVRREDAASAADDAGGAGGLRSRSAGAERG